MVAPPLEGRLVSIGRKHRLTATMYPPEVPYPTGSTWTTESWLHDAQVGTELSAAPAQAVGGCRLVVEEWQASNQKAGRIVADRSLDQLGTVVGGLERVWVQKSSRFA